MKASKLRTVLALVLALMLAFSCAAASAAAKAIRLKYTKATLQAGKSATLKVRVSPAGSPVSWKSSNTAVATVTQSGRITALKAGVSTITATSGGVNAKCLLTVKAAKITRVILSEGAKSLALGAGSFRLTASVRPAGADASVLTWKSSDPAIATVDQSGLVTLKKAGTVKIAAVSPGGRKGICTLKITGASSASAVTRRALVIGEGRKNAKYGLAALPMVSSEVSDIAAMFAGNGISASTLVNGTRAGVLSAIKKSFSGADADDVSYLYITCHGGSAGGVYRIFPCGDGYLTAAQLKSALDQVPGAVVLMLGSCQSGSVIAKSAAPAQFLEQFLGAQSKSGEFKADKYQVLCACRSSESGYGVITTSGANGQILSEYTYNFFGKAVQEGGAGAADASGDGTTTMQELYGYVKARVAALHEMWRDKIGLGVSDTQTVVVYPASSTFALFS